MPSCFCSLAGNSGVTLGAQLWPQAVPAAATVHRDVLHWAECLGAEHPHGLQGTRGGKRAGVCEAPWAAGIRPPDHGGAAVEEEALPPPPLCLHPGQAA